MKTFNQLFTKALLVASVIIAAVSPQDLQAQKQLEKLADLRTGKWKNTMISSYDTNTSYDMINGLVTQGAIKREDVKMPKKIAIIGMQIWDKSTTKTTTFGNTIYSRTDYITDAGGNVISNKFKSIMLPAIKGEFAKYGIEVIEPQDLIKPRSSEKFTEKC